MSKTFFKKMFRDLTLRWGSTLVAVLALASGLWGMGSLAVSMFILIGDLPTNYRNTNPPHVIYYSTDFENLDLKELRSNPNIDFAEFRDEALLRMEVEKDRWLPLHLYGMRKGKNFIAKYASKKDQDVAKSTTIFVERDIKKISNLRRNSIARIQSGGRVLESQISELVFDAGRAPSTQDAIVYAYTNRENFSRLTRKTTNERLLIRFKKIKSLKEVEEGVAYLSTFFLQQNHIISKYKIPKYDEHPHQFQLNTLLALNAIIGFLAFLMAMVLVSLLMNSLFSQQVRQIGIMKAIGADRRQILLGYIFYLFVLSGSSIMIGLPLAVYTGKAYSAFVANIINFDILTQKLPLYLYVIFVAVGFLLPLIFSLPALLRGTGISVLEAFSDYGIEGIPRAKKKPNLPRFTSSWVMAIRNIGRKKRRMITTMLTMALGVSIFLTGFNIRQSLQNFLDRSNEDTSYDIAIVTKDSPTKFYAPIKALESVKSIEGRIWSEVRVGAENESSRSLHLSVTPRDSKLIAHTIKEGRWMEGMGTEFVINQQAASELKGIVGKKYILTFEKKSIEATLVGIITEFRSSTVYFPKERFEFWTAKKPHPNTFLVSLKDSSYENLIKVKGEIETIIIENNFDIGSVISHAERSNIILEHLNIILTVLLLFSILVLIVGAMGMGSAMGINVTERTREIGVLSAIGATPKVILRLFVIEGFIVSLLSILVGFVISLPMSGLAAIFFGDLILGEETPLEVALSSEGILITLIITMLFGYVASRLPAQKATRLKIREALDFN